MCTLGATSHYWGHEWHNHQCQMPCSRCAVGPHQSGNVQQIHDGIVRGRRSPSVGSRQSQLRRPGSLLRAPCTCDAGKVNCAKNMCTLGATSHYWGHEWHNHQCQMPCSRCAVGPHQSGNVQQIPVHVGGRRANPGVPLQQAARQLSGSRSPSVGLRNGPLVGWYEPRGQLGGRRANPGVPPQPAARGQLGGPGANPDVPSPSSQPAHSSPSNVDSGEIRRRIDALTQ